VFKSIQVSGHYPLLLSTS